MSAKSANALQIADLPLLANAQKVLLATARLQAHAYAAGMRYQIEMLDFLKHRYEQDVKLVDDLVSSDEFNDAFDVVSGFIQNAATEYKSEAGKIASIGSKLSSETVRRVRKQADEMVEDQAAKSVG